MTDILDIYKGGENLINIKLRKEMLAQGHHLNGDMAESLDAEFSRKGKAEVMEGYAIYYTHWVNNGFPASSASYKQVPFLIEYFIQKGYPVHSSSGMDATKLAFATVTKWMKEGMPTQASKRFSTTGSRTGMIETAFFGMEPELDNYIGNGLDFVVDEYYHKEKSETI